MEDYKKTPVMTSSWVTPVGASTYPTGVLLLQSDVQNTWDDKEHTRNTHTRMHEYDTNRNIQITNKKTLDLTYHLDRTRLSCAADILSHTGVIISLHSLRVLAVETKKNSTDGSLQDMISQVWWQ